MCRDIALWGKKGGVQPQGNFPPNVHNFSSIPWLHYTEINLNLYTDGDFLPPIITVGQAAEQNGRLMLPVTLQIHHSVADGLGMPVNTSAFSRKLPIPRGMDRPLTPE